jgi:hypothetical protein
MIRITLSYSHCDSGSRNLLWTTCPTHGDIAGQLSYLSGVRTLSLSSIAVEQNARQLKLEFLAS